MKNIFLIGYMGSGKSTVAEYLSKNCGLQLLEMDAVIAEKEKKSISDIFAECGEEYFRDLETQLLTEIQAKDNQVISCGGGVVLRPGNIEKMHRSGYIVLLFATPETILERVRDDDSRPLLKGNKNAAFIREMMEKRQKSYETAADYVIHTDGRSIEAICAELLEQIKP